MVKEDKIVRGKNLGQLGTIIKSYLQDLIASNKGVVWVTYNSSSWEDIDTAWRNGKLVCCKYGGMVYQLIWDGTSTPVDYIFVHLSANYLRKLKCSTTLVNNQPSGTSWSNSETRLAYYSDIDTAVSGKADKPVIVTKSDGDSPSFWALLLTYWEDGKAVLLSEGGQFLPLVEFDGTTSALFVLAGANGVIHEQEYSRSSRLWQAHTHNLYQKPSGGIPDTDLTSAVQALLGKTIASVSTPSPADGTILITLSNGDVYTLDLNHQHTQYLKYAFLEDESEMPVIPDATTLYLINEEEDEE